MMDAPSWQKEWAAYQTAEAAYQKALEEFNTSPDGQEDYACVQAAAKTREAAWKAFSAAFKLA